MLKTILRKFIEKRGFIIYKKSTHFQQKNAFDYNSFTNTNKFYGSLTNLKKYLSNSRNNAFKEILKITKKDTTAQPLKILDAGCGCGFLTKLIKDEFPDAVVKGEDYSDVAIEYGKTNFTNIIFEQTDLYKFQSEKFDLIFCTSVLEHLKFPELILSNFANALTENGKIIITIPNGRTDFFEGHIHFWSPESWELFLDKTIPDRSFKIHLLKSKPDILTIIG